LPEGRLGAKIERPDTSPIPSTAAGAHVDAVSDITLPEKVLLAAFQLEEEGQSPFSAEALVVRAWQQQPRTFGLKGYAEQYPDSSKVLVCLMGVRGLVKRGWLSRLGQKLYAVSREGRQMVRRLTPEDADGPPAGPVRLRPELETLLVAALAGSAWQKERAGRRHELTFADACRFWGVDVLNDGLDPDAQVSRVRGGLAEAERLLGRGSAVLPGGHTLTGAEATALAELEGHLGQRFSRHLTLLRSRAG
jgi:hypothetical protein